MKGTVCTECSHYVYDVKNEAAPEVWYNHRCNEQNYRDERINWVLGVRVPAELAYCRDVNVNGDCPFFRRK